MFVEITPTDNMQQKSRFNMKWETWRGINSRPSGPPLSPPFFSLRLPLYGSGQIFAPTNFVPGGRFSKAPKLNGPFSGVTIPFVTQERRAFNSSNLTVIFLFVTLKACEKIGFPKQAVGNFTDGFSGLSRNGPLDGLFPWNSAVADHNGVYMGPWKFWDQLLYGQLVWTYKDLWTLTFCIKILGFFGTTLRFWEIFWRFLN